jgi:branched-chain amino acid transport system substrate-binding protein
MAQPERREVALTVSARLVGAVLAIVATALLPVAAMAQSGPLRIGLVTVRTGPLAAPGKQIEDGFNLFLRERGGELAGRKVELTVLDSAGSPATAKIKAQELVERYNVHIIVGPLASNEALAIQDYIAEAKVPLISPSALAEDVTQRKANPWVVRATSTSSQMSHAMGDYAAKTLAYKRVATIATDFAFGHETVGGFQKVFEESGGRVVKKIWAPVNAVDFGTYIAQIPDVDAVYASFSGASAQNFIRQYAEYGRKAKTPLLVSHSTVDESLLKGMGEDAVGILSVAHYSAAIDTPENQTYARAFTKQSGTPPGFYSTGAYVAGLFIETALKAVNGNIEDKAAFMNTLRATKLAGSPRGNLSLDQYGNPVCDVYIRKVERKDGNLQNTIVKTYPQLTQFWTYDPKQFLQQPAYSRDYPPSRYLEK